MFALLRFFFKLRVTLVMRSGARTEFLCDSFITRKSNATGELVEITAEGARYFPHYTRLEDVALVLKKNVSRWYRVQL